ncbi:quinol monooxygenase YgiN [Planotetraspora sp. GP83]
MLGGMLSLIRYSVPGARTEEFTAQARDILDVLAAQPGYLWGQVGRSVDEPALWALVSEWEGAGYYRRALSAARMAMYPLMTLMINEPSAFEGVYGLPETPEGDLPGIDRAGTTGEA